MIEAATESSKKGSRKAEVIIANDNLPMIEAATESLKKGSREAEVIIADDNLPMIEAATERECFKVVAARL